MRFHYAGKFNGDPATLKNQRMVRGATEFKEPSIKGLALVANGISIVLLLCLIAIGAWRSNGAKFNSLGFALSIVTLLPHEYLHALCYQEDGYFYTYFSRGMIFVVGQEDMSKARFIFMSMLPNLVFGFIPFILFLINPMWRVLGTLGTFAISFGVGDYINAFNALIQMPRGAVTFLYRQHSYWYIPQHED